MTLNLDNRVWMHRDGDDTWTVTLRMTDMDADDIAAFADELDANQWAYHAELLRAKLQEVTP